MSTTVTQFDQALRDATTTYLARKDRSQHPDGSFDSAKRWYPSASERQDCCDTIRTPSAAYPYSLMVHCRTAEHIAQCFGVEASAVKQAVRQQRPRRAPTVHTRYKVVRIVASPLGDLYTSLYDHTVYRVGASVRQGAKPRHGGGYYVRPLTATHLRSDTLAPWGVQETVTLTEAFLRGDVYRRPESGTYAILECHVWGRCVAYESGKEAWTFLKPVREIERFSVEN